MACKWSIIYALIRIRQNIPPQNGKCYRIYVISTIIISITSCISVCNSFGKGRSINVDDENEWNENERLLGDVIYLLWINVIIYFFCISISRILCNWIIIIYRNKYTSINNNINWMGIMLDFFILFLSSIYQQGQNCNYNRIFIISVDLNNGINC